MLCKIEEFGLVNFAQVLIDGIFLFLALTPAVIPLEKLNLNSLPKSSADHDQTTGGFENQEIDDCGDCSLASKKYHPNFLEFTQDRLRS